MQALFRFSAARRNDPAVEAWFAHVDPLRRLAEPWFERLRACGPGARELIHDGRPTVCLEDAAFAYVDVYSQHAAIGFFFGADLEDPAGLLKGAGKRMRHVKLRLGRTPDETALSGLLTRACEDIRQRLDEIGP